MATGAAIMVGGEYSTGPAEGQYHVVVNDAVISASKTKGTPQIVLDFVVKNDPNHQGKEGKKLSKMWQTLPHEGQDPEKRKSTQGFIKRVLFDGFGIPWPEKPAAIDPRQWVGKSAWVLMQNKKDERGERTQITAIAQSQEALPVLSGAKKEAPAAKANGARGSRR